MPRPTACSASACRQRRGNWWRTCWPAPRPCWIPRRIRHRVSACRGRFLWEPIHRRLGACGSPARCRGIADESAPTSVGICYGGVLTLLERHMTVEGFDLLVIGGGSGGLAAAIRAAKHGVKVALIEPGELGGTCVNVGCVPKKAMWYAAQMAEAQYIAMDYGFHDTPGTLDWPRFIERREEYIERIHGKYQQALDKGHVTVVRETGRFIAKGRVRAGERELTAPHIIVSTGSKEKRLDKPGFDLAMDSDGFFDLRACPARTAIIGGGYIAVELAGVLRALGSDVHMYVRGRLMGGFDEEMANGLGEEMEQHGIH